ncbi:MAG: hypothetical protein ACKVQS_10520 [Fimbriimonadaceae bacterium]
MDSILKLFPEHGFHQLLVHFLIALFNFGALLEAIGQAKKNDLALKATGWSLLASALMTLATVPTGFVIFFNFGYSWQGIVLTHAILAGVSTVLMLTTAIGKVRKIPTSAFSHILLAVAKIKVAATGHYRGQLIYGQ